MVLSNLDVEFGGPSRPGVRYSIDWSHEVHLERKIQCCLEFLHIITSVLLILRIPRYFLLYIYCYVTSFLSQYTNKCRPLYIALRVRIYRFKLSLSSYHCFIYLCISHLYMKGFTTHLDPVISFLIMHQSWPSAEFPDIDASEDQILPPPPEQDNVINEPNPNIWYPQSTWNMVDSSSVKHPSPTSSEMLKNFHF